MTWLSARTCDGSWIVLDFETTGTAPSKDRVIEVAAIRYRHGEAVDSFSSLINPGVGISSRIELLTGINNEMVENAPEARSVIPKLIRFLGTRPIIAHNARFDRSFLAAEMQRCGIEALIPPFACTLRLSRAKWPYLKSYRLDSLIESLELPVGGQLHRAMADAQATGHLWKRLLEKTKRSPTFDDVEQLHDEGMIGESRADAEKLRKMREAPFDIVEIMGGPPIEEPIFEMPLTGQRRKESDTGLNEQPVDDSEIGLLIERAACGDPKAPIRLAELAFDGAYIGDAWELLPGWLGECAKHGSSEAARWRAELSRSGDVSGEDVITAIHWFERAADLGCSESAFMVGALFADGSEVPKDIDRAVRWFERAARMGSPKAAFNLAHHHAESSRKSNAGRTAVRWYEFAYEQGDADAAFNLALLYEAGEIVDGDFQKALMWYAKAGAAGHPEAARAHNELLESIDRDMRSRGSGLGEGIPPQRAIVDSSGESEAERAKRMGDWFSAVDAARADFWYQVAADLGSEAARQALGKR